MDATKQRACLLGPEDALCMARSEKVNAAGGEGQSGCRQTIGERAAAGPDAGSSGHGKLWKAFKTTGSQIERNKGKNCLTQLLILWMIHP